MIKAAYRRMVIWVPEGESVMLGQMWQLPAACGLEQKLRAQSRESSYH